MQWEKKTTAAGSGTNLADPHDVDNTYSWTTTAGGTTPGGTVFTDFLNRLNGCVTLDGTAVTGGFAGHCDWRLPTITELRSILSAPPGEGCVTGPCIDPIFGPTTLDYWSSTTDAVRADLAWVVYFTDGTATEIPKDPLAWARAVRGGL